MINIVYDSKTGNVERFCTKVQTLANRKNLQLNILKLEPKIINEINFKFHLITHTTGFGEIPLLTLNLLEQKATLILSVSSSGNRNWGQNFAIAAKKISIKYKMPVKLEFELSGTEKEVDLFLKKITQGE